MAEYFVLAKLKLDTSGVKSELAQISKEQQVKVNAKVTGTKDAELLNLQISKLQNRLESIKIRNQTAFENPEILEQYKNLKDKLIPAYDGTQKSMARIQDGMGKFRNSITQANLAGKETKSVFSEMTAGITTAIGKMALWGIAANAIYGTLRKIGDGVEYIKDLNKELVNIGLVTGQSVDELQSMGAEFNALAKNLGVSTLTVAEGATNWIRQGKSAAETTMLLSNSTKLATLGNLEASDATDKLTAILNAYNISATDSIRVVDTLVELDNRLATSTGEIADAMEKSSSMAKQAGVSYQDLAAYISVVSSITRQSGDTIGQSFKTIFARMEQVKAGAKIDEEGEAINNVEAVLLKQGISIRENNESFRDMSDVLADVAKKYEELGKQGRDVEQGQILTAIAGTRQINIVSALFDNWDEVIKAQGYAVNSAGLADERYEIYLTGIEASTNRAKAAWEGFANAVIDDNLIVFVNELSASFAELLTGATSGNPIKDLMDISKELQPFSLLLKTISNSYMRVVLASRSLFGDESAKSGLKEMGNIWDNINGFLVDHLSLLKSIQKNIPESKWLKNIIKELEAQKEQKEAIEDVDQAYADHISKIDYMIEGEEEAASLSDNLSASLDEQKESVDALSNAMDVLSSAQQEQIDNGHISAATAIDLIESNATLAQYLRMTADGYVLDAEGARIALQAEMELQFANYGLEVAANAAAKGNYKFAASAIAASNASKEQQASLMGLLKSFANLSMPVLPSGGGSQTYSAKDAYDDLLKITIAMLKQEAQDRKKNLQDQLEAYKKIIDKQKDLLDLKQKEKEYNDDIAEKNKTIADIDNELLQIQFDNSEEAEARRKELADERAKALKDLEDTQADYSVETQKDALDAEYEAYKDTIDAQLDVLDKYLARTGEITQEAMALIESRSASYYNALIEYNRAYGDGVDATVQKMWDLADAQATVVSGYGSIAAAAAKAQSASLMNVNDFGGNVMSRNDLDAVIRQARGYSEGGMGIVPPGYENDNYPIRLKSGELFMVFNQQQQAMMNTSSMPKPISVGSNQVLTSDSGTTFGDIVVQIMGNMDEGLIPKLVDAVTTKLNNTMKNRGIRRDATSMQI